MPRTEYWREFLEDSFYRNSITATEEQISEVVKEIQIAIECIDQAFYMPENPLVQENKDLKNQLEIEKIMVTCKRCNGTGEEVDYWLDRMSIGQCSKCNGEGKHLPE